MSNINPTKLINSEKEIVPTMKSGMEITGVAPENVAKYCIGSSGDRLNTLDLSPNPPREVESIGTNASSFGRRPHDAS